jgi:hypothetical protein
MHPLIELTLNPFAGSAGINLIAIMFYIALVLLLVVAILERSMKS